MVEQETGLVIPIPSMSPGRVKLESWDKQLPIPEDQEPGWETDPATLLLVPDRRLLAMTDEPLHSFTRSFFNWLSMAMMGLDGLDTPSFGDGFMNWRYFTQISPAVQTGRLENITYSELSIGQTYRAVTGQDDEGIIVGTASGHAFSFDDHTISGSDKDQWIRQGTGAGQLSYVQSELHTRSWDLPTRKWTSVYKRFFNNNSGGSITAAEVCMVMAISSTTLEIMVARDVLGTPITVNDGGQLLVTYTLVSAAFEGP